MFTPRSAAINEAKEITNAMNETSKNGDGANVYRGRMIDIASIKQAEILIQLANLMKSDL